MKEDRDSVVTESSFPFAHTFLKLLIKDICDQFDFVSFEDSDSSYYPDSMEAAVVHKIKGYQSRLYFNKKEGYFLGYEVFDEGKVIGRVIHKFNTNHPTIRPLAVEYYFENGGRLVLDRVILFLDWELIEDFNSEKCFLSFYDLPEPSFVEKKANWKLWITIFCFSFLLIYVVFFILKQQRLT